MIHPNDAGAAHNPGSSKMNPPKVILIVDDESSVREIAERALERLGYDVRSAGGGEQALAILGRVRDIDLLITDVVMPGMDGRELARRAMTVLPGLKVLYMSGYAEGEILSQGRGPTNVAFLAKPYSLVALAAHVAELLDV